jgi:two-component system chemotaxis sensor kinase CheA
VDDSKTDKEAARAISVLLFYGLDGVRRAMPMSAVNRVDKVDTSVIRLAGEKSQVVIDERIVPIAGADLGPLPEGRVSMFRLGDGQGEMGYAFQQMIDIASIDAELSTESAGGDLAGIALIDGEPVEVVDSHALFARCMKDAPGDLRPVARMPGKDRWFQEFLRPMVEAAGYRVVDESDESEADIAIASRGGSDEENRSLPAAQAIWLRATRDAANKKDDSIYRYDRDGLMAALQAARAGRNR